MSKIGLVVATALIGGTAAQAGNLYVNGEYNGITVGDDNLGGTTELHIGYEGDAGVDSFNYYLQAGPAFLSPDGADSDTQLSGKVGAGIQVSDNLSGYGEVAFVTGDDENTYGTKLGVKYAF
tara:strand:- start:282 stop:647 length:366 start_codon:yes stop_codon:yes gene_type:complete